jgi:hypothetical protein
MNRDTANGESFESESETVENPTATKGDTNKNKEEKKAVE